MDERCVREINGGEEEGVRGKRRKEKGKKEIGKDEEVEVHWRGEGARGKGVKEECGKRRTRKEEKENEEE